MSKRTRQLTPADIRKHSPIKNYEKLKGFDEDKPVSNYSKIMSKIYLGTIYASEDPDFFKNRNIKAVLNCSNDIPHSFKSKDIEYMRIPVEDSLKIYDYNKMYHFLNIAADFIYKHAVLQKQAILIQCFAGKQRSAISVAAFLVKYHNMTPYEACKYIMEKRPEAFHFGLSLNFEQSLQEFYKDIKKCPFKSRQPKFKST
jgi:protein-tyrosine phosphatase